MFAVQLLRVLETVPPNISNDTCIAIDIVKLEAKMKENPNWETFDDNDDDQILKRSETGDKDLHTDRKFDQTRFENKNDFVASPIVPFSNERDLYTDKNVTEFNLPEFVVCYRENPVKDIWVDDGMPLKEKILSDGQNFEDLVSEPEVEIELGISECEITEEVGIKVLALEEPNLAKNLRVVGNDKEGNHNASGETADDISSFGKSCELKSLKTLFDSRSSDDSESERLSDQVSHLKTTGEKPAEGSIDDDSNKSNSKLSYNSKFESGAITFDFESIKVESESIKESLENKDNAHEQSVKLNGLLTHDTDIPKNLADESKVQHGLGESSFSRVGPVSGRINYSGSIPFSGSLSIRSDSSTTSTRSFAFPILQNEWNSSPVRMAKAHRKRSWRNGLFCCRF